MTQQEFIVCPKDLQPQTAKLFRKSKTFFAASVTMVAMELFFVIGPSVNVAMANDNSNSGQSQDQGHSQGNDQNDSNQNDNSGNHDQNNQNNGNSHDQNDGSSDDQSHDQDNSNNQDHSGDDQNHDQDNNGGGHQSGQCVMTITKSVDQASAQSGDTLTYTINFQNTGTANCTGGGVHVADAVDTNLTFVNSITSGNVDAGYNSTPLYETGSRRLHWNAHVLTPGQSGWVKFTATVNDPATCGQFDIPNTAKITSTEYDNGNTWVQSNTVHTAGNKDCNLPPPPKTGSITVCKMIIDSNNKIVDGSQSPSVTFTIPGLTPDPVTSLGAPVGQIPDSVFINPLSFNAKILAASTSNDAQCLKYDNLAIGAYYYGQETISNPTGWATPKYNDQFTVTIATLSDFFAYDGNLFDGNQANDGSRNQNVDGHIVLNNDRPDRTLVVLNQLQVLPPTLTSATLIVKKHVINDDGGTKQAADFTMQVTGTNVSQSSFAGSETGKTVTLDAGTYSVDEAVDSSYTKTLGENCSGSIAAGETKTCTVTNDDIANPPSEATSTLVVIKHVINDNGGTATSTAFILHVKNSGNTDVSGSPAPGSETGTTYILNVGTYTVTEDSPTGYAGSFSGDCDHNGSVTLQVSETKTCTLTNDDVAQTSGGGGGSVTVQVSTGGGGGGGGGSPTPANPNLNTPASPQPQIDGGLTLVVPTPQVAGANTLPRTGMDPISIMVILLLSLLPFAFGKKRQMSL